MLMTNWQVPSEQLQADGVIALMPLVYYCQLENKQLMRVEYSGGCLIEGKAKNARTPKIAPFLRYTEVMLKRRAARGDDLPNWWKDTQ